MISVLLLYTEACSTQGHILKRCVFTVVLEPDQCNERDRKDHV